MSILEQPCKRAFRSRERFSPADEPAAHSFGNGPESPVDD
jgi:hypothetical protein